MAKGKKTVTIGVTKGEVSDEKSMALISYVADKNLPDKTTADIIATVGPIFKNIEVWKHKVSEIIVTSSEDSEGMKIAKEARLDVMRIRTALKKQIDEKKLQIKTERIDPIKREYDGWADMFEFIEGMLKGVEKDLRDKEEFAKNLIKKEQDELREARRVLAEPYRTFMPPMVDIALLSQEDFDRALDTAKLAFEGEKIRREKEQKEALEREEENNKLKIINSRINLLSSMNFKFVDGDYIFGETIKVSSSMVKEMSVDDFNTYITSVESQIREIEKEAKEIEERERLEKAEAADKKRKIIMDRISKIDFAKIERDGLYLDIYGIGKEFLIDYDELYSFSDEVADEYINQMNINSSKKTIDLQNKRDQEEQLRLERLAAAKKAQEEAERLAKEKRDAEEREAMSDKAKLRVIADEVWDFQKDIDHNYSLTSDAGRNILNRVISDLKNITEYIDSKIK